MTDPVKIAVVDAKGRVTLRDATPEEVVNLAELGHDEALGLFTAPVQAEPNQTDEDPDDAGETV